MRRTTTITTLSCDVRDCPAEVSSVNQDYFKFLEMIKGWGWRTVLDTSPHPPRRQGKATTAWAITTYFCPEHQELADHPERYTIADCGKLPGHTVDLLEK